MISSSSPVDPVSYTHLKKYRQSFATSELGRLHSLFPFSELARQMHLKSSPCLLYTSDGERSDGRVKHFQFGH